MFLFRCYNRHGAKLYGGEHENEEVAWKAAFDKMMYPEGMIAKPRKKVVMAYEWFPGLCRRCTMYVVFDVDSTMEMRSYKQFHHAREYCRRLNEDENKDFPPGVCNIKWKRTYDVQHVDFYNEYVVHWVQVKNLMSGELVWQKSNTPLACDPSSETYWSM